MIEKFFSYRLDRLLVLARKGLLLGFVYSLIMPPINAQKEQSINISKHVSADNAPANFKTNTAKIRVALFLDRGAHPRTSLEDALTNDTRIQWEAVYGDDVRAGKLSDFDILIVPGGSGRREALSLTSAGRDEVTRFVREGGIYVGICAGCYLASCARADYLGMIPLKTADAAHWRRGKAFLPIEFTEKGKEIFGVDTAQSEVLYHNGPVFAAPRSCGAESPPFETLASYRAEIVAPEGKPGLMTGAPAMLLSHYGKGNILAISPHPEGTPGLKSIEVHAIHWLYDNRSATSSSPSNNEGQ